MDKRFGLIGVLAIGCLAFAPALTGCSSPSVPDAGSDAGSDGGSNSGMADASNVDSHGLGMSCKPANDTQGDCSPGLSCSPLATGNTGMCTLRQCAQSSVDGGTTALPHCADAGSSTCGETEQCLENVCLAESSTTSFCARGCVPSTNSDRASADLEACQRNDFSCWAGEDNNGNAIHFCFPDCRVSGNACAYGASCDMQTGECNFTDCSTKACSSGQVCFSDTAAQSARFCVPDCRASGNTCPADRSCNTGTGVCDPVVHQAGETCGPGVAICDPSTVCVSFGGSSGECLTKCKGDGDCNAYHASCDLQVSSDVTVCDPPGCDVDAGSSCATGLQCSVIQKPQGGMIQGCIPD